MNQLADHGRRTLLTALTFLLVVIVGAAPALAEPTAEDEEAARAAANTAAAEFTCELLPIPNEDIVDKCVDIAEGVAAKAPSFEEIQPQLMCTALLPLGPVVTVGCVGLVTANVGGLRDAAQEAYDATIGKAGEVIDTAKDAAEFVQDPGSVLEDLANQLKEAAVDFLNIVMGELVNIGNADFTAEWWRNSYAAAGGIGLVVAAIMMILVLKDASQDRISAHQFGESIQYLVGGIISMVWAPVVAYVIQNLIATFNQGIISWGGEDIYETVLEGAIYSMTALSMPGGIIMGLVFWLLLFSAAFLVFLMFIAQGMAVYLTSVAMAIAFGMLAHPRWRAKALRVPTLVLGIMLAKPALLFVITVLFKMIQSFDPMDLIGIDALQALGEGCMIVCALFLIGLAPWAAFKFFPLLPDGSEVDGGGIGPASAAGAAAGGAGGMMTNVGMRRMGGGSSGGGGGQSSGSGGQSSGKGTGSSSMGDASKAPTPGGAASKSAGAGKAAGAAGGAGKAGAAGGLGKAAAAGGGAMSGGALLLAGAAAKGGQAAGGAAKTAAESSTPGAQGATGEEQQSSLHDRRKLAE